MRVFIAWQGITVLLTPQNGPSPGIESCPDGPVIATLGVNHLKRTAYDLSALIQRKANHDRNICGF